MNIKFPPTRSMLVSYSGGKDSLVCLDLSIRAKMQVKAFFMYLVPGLDYTEFWVEYAKKRWGIEVETYQHWSLGDQLAGGIFLHEQIDAKSLGYFEMISYVKAKMGMDWVAIGFKSNDSLERRAMMNKWPGGVDPIRKLWAPIKSWSQNDVFAYLKSRDVIVPDKLMNARNTGVSVHPQCLLYFRENWPDDYQRILNHFPLAAAQADRAVEILARNAADRETRKQNRKHAYDRSRPSAAKRGYGRYWREVIVPAILARDPICRICGIAESEDVDHRIPKRDGGTDDPENLWGLCHSCHSSKTVDDIGLNA